jgi:hypothetical protein
MIGAEIEALVLLIVLIVAFLLYRGLIRSKWFGRLVGGVKPLPESDEEILAHVSQAEQEAQERAETCEAEAAAKKQRAKRLRKRSTWGRGPTPRY